LPGALAGIEGLSLGQVVSSWNRKPRSHSRSQLPRGHGARDFILRILDRV
jgi:hypothetical protein